MPQPRVLVLRAPGTNCDEETAAAWTAAGAAVETLHVGRILEAPGPSSGSGP
jgi:phosphoribosylformylglycinamidine synthase